MPDLAPVPPRSIAGIASFRDRDRLLAALHAALGAAPPDTARFVSAGAATLACIAPARYLAWGAADANLPAHLARTLDGLAAITDQSDMWASWRVSGADVRECLARVVPIDLAPDIFQVGDLALTRAGHLDVRVCRVDSEAYEVAATRSVAADLLHVLEQACRGLPSFRPEALPSSA